MCCFVVVLLCLFTSVDVLQSCPPFTLPFNISAMLYYLCLGSGRAFVSGTAQPSLHTRLDPSVPADKYVLSIMLFNILLCPSGCMCNECLMSDTVFCQVVCVVQFPAFVYPCVLLIVVARLRPCWWMFHDGLLQVLVCVARPGLLC